MEIVDLILAGWRGAIGAVQRNAVLFAGAFVAIFVLHAIYQFVVPPLHFVTTTGLNPHMVVAGHSVFRWWITLIYSVLSAIVFVPCMVAVHRFILLGEEGTALRNQSRLIRFGTFLVAILVIEAVGVVLPHILALIFGIAALIVLVRLVLTYPALALDRPRPLDESWNKSRGHWWFIAGTMVGGLLPLMVVFALLGLLFGGREFAMGHPGFLGMAVMALAGVVYVTAVAALASELYRKFGGMEQAGETARTGV